MSWVESSQTYHSFQEWAGSILGPKWREESKQSAIAKTIDTPKASSDPESQTVDLTTVPFGLMSTISTESRGKERTSLAEGFPAKTLALPAKEKASKKGTGLAFSMNLCAYAAKYNPDSSSWRTSQGSLFTQEPIEYSENWPVWGLMLDGKLFPHPMLEQITGDSESGLWPTPRANDAEKRGQISDDPRNGLPGGVENFPTPQSSDWKGPNNSNSGSQSSNGLATKAGGKLNPTWVEWLMNFGSEWTALNVLETLSFLSSQSRLGKKSKDSLE